MCFYAYNCICYLEEHIHNHFLTDCEMTYEKQMHNNYIG